MEEEDKEMCRNCKRDIPCSNYQMHTAHCARHITLCSKCNEPIPKKEFDQHECETEQPPPLAAIVKEAPIAQPKPTLTEQTFRNQMVASRKKSSSAMGPAQAAKQTPASSSQKQQQLVDVGDSKMVICQYCHLEFNPPVLADHENYCGSRTEKCPECSDFVMLKDWEKHQSMRLYHELAKKPSSLVFGRREEEDRHRTSLLQRSASGMVTASHDGATSSSRLHSSENFSANSSRFSSIVTPLQNSKSMRNLDHSLYQASSLKSSHESNQFESRQRSSSVTSRSKRVQVREDVNLEETWNTSVQEQMRLLEEIQKEKALKNHNEDIPRHQPEPPQRRSKSFSSRKKSLVDQILTGKQENDVLSESLPFSAAAVRPSRKREKKIESSASSSLVDKYLGQRRRSTSRSETQTYSTSTRRDSYSDLTNLSSSSILSSSKKTAERTDSFSSKRNGSLLSRQDSIDDLLASTRSQRTTSTSSYSLHRQGSMNDFPSRFKQTASENVSHSLGRQDSWSNLASSGLRSSSRSNRRTSTVENYSYSLSRQDSRSNLVPSGRSRSSRRGTVENFSLNRQDSMSNLNSLQDEINGMLSRQPSRSHASQLVLSESPPRRRVTVAGLDHTEAHREGLRQMLCRLRKDPMDEDLDQCDGDYFPCEFCGDPYPVEYIMRHQLSCDLNPAPVPEGNGFDYAEIARRAAANMAMAKE